MYRMAVATVSELSQLSSLVPLPFPPALSSEPSKPSPNVVVSIPPWPSWASSNPHVLLCFPSISLHSHSHKSLSALLSRQTRFTPLCHLHTQQGLHPGRWTVKRDCKSVLIRILSTRPFLFRRNNILSHMACPAGCTPPQSKAPVLHYRAPLFFAPFSGSTSPIPSGREKK